MPSSLKIGLQGFQKFALSIRASSVRFIRSALQRLAVNWLDAMVLVIIWVFYASNLVIWVGSNRRMLAYDQVIHFFNSVAIAMAMSSPSVFLKFPQFLAGLSARHAALAYTSFDIYPPFVYFVTTVVYLFGSPSLPLATLTNVIFLAVLVVSTYGLSRELLGSRAGIVAAFLVPAYPVLVGLMRTYLLDFALTGVVSLALFLLVRTQEFRDRKAVVLLSLSLVVGMLTKQTFALYVSGPLVYVLLRSWGSRVALKNIVLTAIIASIGVLWYVIKPGGLEAWKYWYQIVPQLRGDVPVPFASLVHLEVMATFGIGIPMFMLFSAGILDIIRVSRNRVFVAIALVTPFLLLGIVQPLYMDPRFTAPILPLVATGSSAVFMNLRWPTRPQLVGVIVVVTFVMAQYASITYDVPMLSGIYTPKGNMMILTYPPSNQDWKIPEVVHDLRADAVARGMDRASLVVLVSHPFFEQTLFLYYAYLQDASLVVLDNGYLSPDNGMRSVCATDYVVTRDPLELSSKFEKNIGTVAGFVESNLGNFELIARYELPDKSVASLYHRNAAVACAASGFSSFGAATPVIES